MRSQPGRRVNTATGQPKGKSASGVFRAIGVRPTRDVDVGDGLPEPPGASDAIAAAIASALCEYETAEPTANDVGIAAAEVQVPEAGGARLPSRKRGVVIGAISVLAVASFGAIPIFASIAHATRNDALLGESDAYASPRSAAVGTAAAVVALPPAPAPEVTSPPPALAAPPSADATTGTITLPSSAAGHRIYVDGRLTAQPSSFVLVRSCGSHVVKIGSRGRDQAIVVPCRGDVALAYR